MLAGGTAPARYEVGDGTPIPLASATVKPTEAGTGRLTIDGDMQWPVQRPLARPCEEAGGESGIAIVMDSTGDPLAFADYPSFDPTTGRLTRKETLRLVALQDALRTRQGGEGADLRRADRRGECQPEDQDHGARHLTLQVHTIHALGPRVAQLTHRRNREVVEHRHGAGRREDQAERVPLTTSRGFGLGQRTDAA